MVVWVTVPTATRRWPVQILGWSQWLFSIFFFYFLITFSSINSYYSHIRVDKEGFKFSSKFLFIFGYLFIMANQNQPFLLPIFSKSGQDIKTNLTTEESAFFLLYKHFSHCFVNVQNLNKNLSNIKSLRNFISFLWLPSINSMIEQT